jgi:hypothetical protein
LFGLNRKGLAVIANAGIPMLFVGMPFMVAVLVPVLLIEAAWYWRFLRIPWAVAWRGSLAANLWSTFLGLPLAWAVWVFVGVVAIASAQYSGLFTTELFLTSYAVGVLVLVASSGWLLPTGSANEVLLLGAGLVLLLPAYLMSYVSEAKILQSKWRGSDPRAVYRQVWLAHLVSYGLLYLIAGYRFYSIAQWGPGPGTVPSAAL